MGNEGRKRTYSSVANGDFRKRDGRVPPSCAAEGEDDEAACDCGDGWEWLREAEKGEGLVGLYAALELLVVVGEVFVAFL